MRTLLALAFFLLAVLPALGRAQASMESTYILGPDDVVVVTVLGHPEFSGEYLIPSSGAVIMPVIGSVVVSGFTPDAVARKVRIGLTKRLRHPEVTAVIKTSRPRRLSVLGDVRNAGVFDIKPGARMTDVLSVAGGLLAGVQTRDVTVRLERGGADRSVVGLDEILSDASKNVEVLPGDLLRFDAAQPISIQVLGRVRAPGQYKVRGAEANLLEIVTLAGGPLEDAQLGSVKILRRDGPEESVNLLPALQRGLATDLPLLRAGDTLIVLANEDRFVVLGYIQRPGYYSVPVGRSLSLVEAVAMASGTNDRSRISRVGLMRMEAGRMGRQVFDLGKFLQKGDLTQNPAVRPGDVIYVPENNRVDLFRSLGTLAGLSLALTRLFR